MKNPPTIQRRERLASLLADGDHVVVFANPQVHMQKFNQDNSFLYLTGLEEPELIYVAGRFAGRFNEMLFIERCDPERVVWEGAKLGPDEASRISGIKRIRYLDEFYSVISSMCPMMKTIYANLGYSPINKPPTQAIFMLDPLRQRYPQLAIRQLDEIVTPLRKVKDHWEVAQLQKAIDITGLGILDIIKGSQPKMFEYELEAMLFYRMQRTGVQRWGFAPIIASGLNAATLHYEKNNCQIRKGDLVLLDVGASWQNYSADITRCFPVNRSFSARQRTIYEIVLNVQKAVIAMIKPGVKLSDLNTATVRLLSEGLIRIKLIKNPDELSKYYMHSVSHFLGMDTHDLGGRESVLEEGNVITVEPGMYIPAEKLGVRIEDDILVTRKGHQVLSASIPKEIEEIEALRQQADV